jgi:hypothetical protein
LDNSKEYPLIIVMADAGSIQDEMADAVGQAVIVLKDATQTGKVLGEQVHVMDCLAY